MGTLYYGDILDILRRFLKDETVGGFDRAVGLAQYLPDPASRVR